MKEKEESNELIAAFMGFPIKTEVVEHEYGYDFRDSYETKIIYSNIDPILVEKNEMFLTKVVDTHENYFDSDEQKENFDYLVYLNYDNSWDSLMSVVEKIEECFDGNVVVVIQDETCQISYSNKYQKYAVFETKLESVYNSIIEFIKWYNEQKL